MSARFDVPITDHMALSVKCGYSNIAEEWWAAAWHESTDKRIVTTNGRTRPDALRNLAVALEEWEPEGEK